MADITAHITGTVWKIECKVGQQVNAGDTLVILESMKMEMPVEASEGGTVKEIRCAEAQPVSEGDVLVVLGQAVGGLVEIADSPLGVRQLTLFNPTRRNALDKPMLSQLRDALTCPPSIRALLIRAAPHGAFCAGYDLNELAALTPDEPLPDEQVAEVCDLISNHALPSVALVTAAAFGAGCELALACDVRAGGLGAAFCMPPVKLGLVYSLRGFARFVNRVGPATARFMFLTGSVVDAGQALQLGVLSVLKTSDSDTEASARELAGALAKASPMAVEGTKLGLRLAIEGAGPVERYHALHEASFRSDTFRSSLASALKKNGLPLNSDSGASTPK